MAPTPKSFQQTFQELWELLKAYAQQETIGPLKNLGRQLGLGLAGSIFISLGVMLLVLGVIRGLDSHQIPVIGSFLQDRDWLIYLIGVLLLVGVIGLCYLKAKPRSDRAAPEIAEENP